MKKKSIIAVLTIAAIVVAGYFIRRSLINKSPETHKVGVILPLTGPFAEYGIPLKRGMDLALLEINSAGGINGKKLELLVEDDKSTSKDAVNADTKLISADKVKLVLGPLSSGNSLAAAPVSEKNKIVQISFLAGIPEFSQAGDYVFRIYPSSELGATFAAESAIKNFQPKKVAVMYVNNPFGEASRRIYSDIAIRNNLSVVATEAFLDGDKDFKTQLTKIKVSQPDIILCSAYWAEGAIILRQMVELNMNMPIVGEDGWHGQLANLVGDKGLSQLYFADIRFGKEVTENPVMQSFIRNYESKYGTPPNTASATGYDALYLTKKMLENTSYEPDAMKKYLYENSFYGALGEIKYDANGDNVGVQFALYKLDSSNNAYMVK